MYPPINQTYWYRALLHQLKWVQNFRWDVPPTNWTQYYRALLHQVTLTCGRMQTYPGQMYPHPPLIAPSGTEPYYTRSNDCKISDEMYNPPANQTQCYRTLIHHVSLACGGMQTHSGQMYPPIDPSATEPYYTMSVWHVAECWHTQVRCTPPLPNWP